ncbi:Hypothetical predicted protein [Olea europaea subsp. europaea]|uniref:Uncharacterized protein n=1 Tax=Olea europaea subsp. europaea TaxID=158383 RepID=A0A8S0SUE4_OLEEU|nr:Hypothetical predicted protein [Olea europaea subsp. europaea]
MKFLWKMSHTLRVAKCPSPTAEPLWPPVTGEDEESNVALMCHYTCNDQLYYCRRIIFWKLLASNMNKNAMFTQN